MLLVGAMLALAVGAVALGWLATGLAAADERQRAADLAALAGARVAARQRLRRRAARGRRTTLPRARRVAARRRGATAMRDVEVRVVAGAAPAACAVVVRDEIRAARHGADPRSRAAEAELAPAARAGRRRRVRGPGRPSPGQADAPRRRARLRPPGRAPRARAGARARRHERATHRAPSRRGCSPRNPDPKWVARPGRSLHRLGTELDLGPLAAYGWLAANARRFGFVEALPVGAMALRIRREPRQRVGRLRAAGGQDGGSAAGVPAARCRRGSRRPTRRRCSPPPSAGASARRCSPRSCARSRASTRAPSRAPARAGSRSSCRPRRAQYGLRDPFDAAAAIDAQAHLMHDLLRRFGSVPLALAAYNAGAGRVAACWCVPPIAETQTYVRRIVALARGRGRSARRRGSCASCAELPLRQTAARWRRSPTASASATTSATRRATSSTRTTSRSSTSRSRSSGARRSRAAATARCSSASASTWSSPRRSARFLGSARFDEEVELDVELTRLGHDVDDERDDAAARRRGARRGRAAPRLRRHRRAGRRRRSRTRCARRSRRTCAPRR